MPGVPVFRFRSPMHAVAVRDCFVQNGVPAQVVGGNTDAAAMWGRHGGAYEVVLGSSADGDLAALLFEQFRSEPAEYEDGLDDQAVPDLGVLDPSMAPPCPMCGVMLPLDASVTACPSCQAEVDVAALIVDRHGPEALAPCYDAMPSSDELLAMDAQPEPCRTCGGPLDERRSCTWCGRRA